MHFCTLHFCCNMSVQCRQVLLYNTNKIIKIPQSTHVKDNELNLKTNIKDLYMTELANKNTGLADVGII